MTGPESSRAPALIIKILMIGTPEIEGAEDDKDNDEPDRRFGKTEEFEGGGELGGSVGSTGMIFEVTTGALDEPSGSNDP